MAKKKPTESALTNVLNTAVELLQDAENDEDDGMITVSNSVYMRLLSGGQGSHRHCVWHRRERGERGR